MKCLFWKFLMMYPGDGWELTMTYSRYVLHWPFMLATPGWQLSLFEWLVLAEVAVIWRLSTQCMLRCSWICCSRTSFRNFLLLLKSCPGRYCPRAWKMWTSAQSHTRADNREYSSCLSTWQTLLWYGENIYIYRICELPSGLFSDNYAAQEKLSLLLISQLALKECFASLKPGWVIFFSLHCHTLYLCHFSRLYSCQTRLIQDVH